MARRHALLAVAVLATLAVPAAAEEGTYSCQVDVGAPFLLVDTGNQAPERVTVGGCQLVHDVAEPTRLAEAEPGDWWATSLAPDCAIQLDPDGDGQGFESLEEGDYVPAGADLWAKCDLGERLDNRVELVPA